MPARHIPALDGVRGLAILLVLVAHLTVWGASGPDGVSGNVSVLGFFGADLFLALSMASYHLSERRFLLLKDRLAPTPELPPLPDCGTGASVV